MIKKLIIMGILMIPFLVLTKVATAQNYEVPAPYEEMPQAVKNQMDENKYNGVSTYTNVVATLEIKVDGLEFNKHMELSKKLSDLKEIKSYKIDSDKFVIVIEGATPPVSVKKVFTGFVTGFQLLSITYSVSK